MCILILSLLLPEGWYLYLILLHRKLRGSLREVIGKIYGMKCLATGIIVSNLNHALVFVGDACIVIS